MNQTMNQSEKSNDATQIARGHIMEAYAHDAGGTLERADLEPKPGGSISLPQGKGRPAIEPGQKMVKMVALVPAALHRRSRIGAAIEGTSLAAIVRAMLAERYPDPQSE